MYEVVRTAPSWQLDDLLAGVLNALCADDSGDRNLIDGRTLAVKA
jgi:hypothetical protein